MDVEEIKRIILDQEDLLREKLAKEKIIKREVSYDVSKANAYLITGPRRAGKSIFAVQLSIGKNYARVDFDDERLAGIKLNDLNRVLEAIYQLKGNVELLIFDEIQNVEGWELFVSRLRDVMPIIITGSNARLMSSEMATYLTGRHLDFILFPFSFREFLRYRGIEATETTKGIGLIKANLQDYLNVGSFPEGYKLNHKLYLRTLFNDVITRDVMLRCKIRKNVKEIANFLAENIGREVSTRRLGSAFSISHQTANNYISCLENSYFFIFLKRFTGKALEKYTLPRKVYLIDPAIHSVIVGSENISRKMENAVLIELLRVKYYNSLSYNVYYYRNGEAEVDFIIDGEIKEAIQVTYEIEGLRDRELRSLEKFSEKFRGFNLKLITWDTEGEEILKNGKKVKVIPLWRFMLKSREVLKIN
ncbi:MAG: ATP-binding protein [Sulfolobaceae archaeon]